MSTQPELPGLRPQIPVSMQDQIVIRSQQKAMDTANISTPVVLTTESVIKNLPVSMAVSMTEVKSGLSNPADSQAELVVVKSQQSSSVDPKVSPTQTQAQTKVVYNLSELVLKEKDTLFKLEDNDSVFILEPPRAATQTVRMRSKNFFTVLEEDEESDEKKAAADSVDNGPTLKGNCPLYTPVFNFGQNLHQIFHSKNRRKQRQNKAVIKAGESTEKPDETDNQQSWSTRPSSGHESDPEHFVHLYEKITINPGSLRRNASQPNLEKCSVEDFMQKEELKVGLSQSQSMPNTPKVSPRLCRRNSANSSDMVKPEVLKPEATGPGLSFLASVAGELRSQKKHNSDMRILDIQSNKVNSNTHVSVVNPDKQVAIDTPDTRANKKQHFLQLADLNAEMKSVERARPSRGHIFKKPDQATLTSTESSPSTSPKRNSCLEEMKANALQVDSRGKKSFMQSIADWSTTPQTKVSNKESNMYSPTSF